MSTIEAATELMSGENSKVSVAMIVDVFRFLADRDPNTAKFSDPFETALGKDRYVAVITSGSFYSVLVQHWVLRLLLRLYEKCCESSLVVF